MSRLSLDQRKSGDENFRGDGSGGTISPPHPKNLTSRMSASRYRSPSPLATSLAVGFAFAEKPALRGADMRCAAREEIPRKVAVQRRSAARSRATGVASDKKESVNIVTFAQSCDAYRGASHTIRHPKRGRRSRPKQVQGPSPLPQGGPPPLGAHRTL